MPLAIQPQDFYQRHTTASRDTWSLGTMRYVVKALNGAQVTIVTDSSVGSAVVGKLVRVFDGGPGRGPRIAVESEYAPGKTQITNYYLPKVGIVIEMGRGNGKFDALKMYHEDRMTALRYVRAQFEDQEYAWGGKWDMRPTGAYDQVSVSREVKKTMEFDHWTVDVARETVQSH